MGLLLRRFWEDRTGATAIEYGLIVAVLSLAIVGGFSRASNSLLFLWSDNNSRLANAFAEH